MVVVGVVTIQGHPRESSSVTKCQIDWRVAMPSGFWLFKSGMSLISFGEILLHSDEVFRLLTLFSSGRKRRCCTL